MNIIEKEAKKFNDRIFYRGNCSISDLNSRLSDKIYDFNRDSDKLEFLRIVRENTVKEKIEHAKTCTGCNFDDTRETGLFVIDQQIDEIKEYYEYEPKPKESFTIEEETALHVKLNEIADKLTELGYGQEIIFNELDELKAHFNLGKKNWFQLVKGKLVDLTVNKVLKETIIKDIYDGLSDGFETTTQFLDKM
ncbi:hypothetical protein [Aequorivita sediminis]|uniref:hypothetical protein n=1 Tax=Aequorivita sediminis TaxID=3073653 RepID=UPI0028B02921|nr:hypothetical protein [Aequorivita sp. F6058]